MDDVNLNQEIDAVVARLSAGEDPRGILTEFARSVRGAGNVTIERDVFKCVNCKNPDCLCFRCKAVSLVGEQGVLAAPMLLAKIAPMISQWAAERKRRKAEEEAEAAARQQAAQQAAHDQARRAPPRGPERF